MGLTIIINAFPQTLLLKRFNAIRSSAAQYSWNTQISCSSHMDLNFEYHTITEICHVIIGGYIDFRRLHRQDPNPPKTFYQRRGRNNEKFHLYGGSRLGGIRM